MKKNFSDPIAVRDETKKVKSPWNFDCPKYDERTSCFVNAGSHYGVGHTQPVGHSGNHKQVVAALPQSKVYTIVENYIPKRNLPLDLEL